MICVLALIPPAAGQLGGSSSSPDPAASSVAGGQTQSVTLGPPSAVYDDGTDAADASPDQRLAPAVDPDITEGDPGSPASALADTSGTADAVAAAGTLSTEAQPASPATEASPEEPASDPAPEPASIPPLSATESDLAALTQASPDQTAPATGTESLRSESLTTQALVRDDASAQINAVFNAINSYRASFGLAAVKYHATVAGMAQEWSDSIASREVIEHRSSFWTDSRALSPTNGAGEVIAVRWDRDAAQLVEWWKGSPAHNAILKDPRFNVMGIGITFTDGNWQTTPNRYTMWGVVNFFGYSSLPAGTTSSPGGSSTLPVQPASVCDPLSRHMPPTASLAAAAIKGPGDLVSVDSSGQLLNRPSLGNRQYGAQQVIGTGFGSAKELFVTDWERDGVFDVLVQWTDGRVTLHSGAAGGGFLTAVTLGRSGWAGMTVAVGGWCANNRLPQLVALDGSGNLWLYPNRGKVDLVERTLMASGVTANRLAMADYDGDGFQDLLARQPDGNVRLYRGSGAPAPRAEARAVVASGWTDVTAIRSLRDVTGLNSRGLALRRAGDVVQYWDLSSGSLASPSSITGAWAGQRLAQ
ncbi:CAP domain-containing protein [Arthrobacter sp. B10-11]|uniref:CAP domain-containing protein n=1 Tax=Arthrobacter sp. B10-11 TaxID=3081160 RepID=UPI0029531DA9|nr:CAP domain-containing protein [Arthrobacter sp. B10-11]MDV8148674.1 CAP domain-containing protein [Arthrobacter sp. B10-11]